MPFDSIIQPELLPVSATLRLRRYDASRAEDLQRALDWYGDEELVRLVDGPDAKPYTDVRGMYAYLDRKGEEYWIEELVDGEFVPIGDVTLCRDDLPIVIGPKEKWGRHIGRQVVQTLVERARALGLDHLGVEEIYDYNLRSQRMFESLGFQVVEKTEQGKRYRLELP